MVLIEVKYKKDLEILDKYKQSHAEYLTSFYDKGLILESGPYNNRAGAIPSPKIYDNQTIILLFKVTLIPLNPS